MADDTHNVSEQRYADACVNLLRQWNNWGGVFSDADIFKDACTVYNFQTPERLEKFGTLVHDYATRTRSEMIEAELARMRAR